MTAKSFSGHGVEKVLMKFQLPNSFKKIGIALILLSFLGLMLNSLTAEYRLIAKYGMLLGFLIISISKEKIEDELIRELRMQSYSFAFIVGVLYALTMPFLDFGVDAILNPDNAVVKGMGDFMILWLLLSIQVFYFESLKRRHQ